jgi:hypothetical protein
MHNTGFPLLVPAFPYCFCLAERARNDDRPFAGRGELVSDENRARSLAKTRNRLPTLW